MTNIITVLALLFGMQNSHAANLPILPDKTLSPGVINPEATKEIICVKGYTSGLDKHGNKVRNVSEATKNEVFKRYKLNKNASHFEIDHIISLELGGKNDISNLYPESYDTKPYNAHTKDRLENVLHKKVCNEEITLQEAQKAISTNWIDAYKKYIGDIK